MKYANTETEKVEYKNLCRIELNSRSKNIQSQRSVCECTHKQQVTIRRKIPTSIGRKTDKQR